EEARSADGAEPAEDEDDRAEHLGGDGPDAVERLMARVDATKAVSLGQDPVDDTATEPLGDSDDDAVDAAPLIGDDQSEGLFPTEDEGDEINRGTLLKFLSSVRT
ncbi:MAG: hypothetical protein ACC652_10350, partial [Acidimicrobiales bacterium]